MEIEEIKVRLRGLVPEFTKQVAPLYRTLNWKWGMPKEPNYIPNATAIRKALHLLIDNLNEENMCQGLGGLEVYYRLLDDEADEDDKSEESWGYGLKFILKTENYYF